MTQTTKRIDLSKQPLAQGFDGTYLAVETPLTIDIENFIRKTLSESDTKEKLELIKALAELANAAYIH